MSSLKAILAAAKEKRQQKKDDKERKKYLALPRVDENLPFNLAIGNRFKLDMFFVDLISEASVFDEETLAGFDTGKEITGYGIAKSGNFTFHRFYINKDNQEYLIILVTDKNEDVVPGSMWIFILHDEFATKAEEHYNIYMNDTNGVIGNPAARIYFSDEDFLDYYSEWNTSDEWQKPQQQTEMVYSDPRSDADIKILHNLSLFSRPLDKEDEEKKEFAIITMSKIDDDFGSIDNTGYDRTVAYTYIGLPLTENDFSVSVVPEQ